MEIQASVIIVNWNGRELLQGCLESILPQCTGHNEVLVVDNGSADGSCEMIAARFPQVRVLHNRGNIGFAAAMNRGVGQSKGALILSLNNDAWVEPGWLEAMVAVAEQDQRVGMVACPVRLAGKVGLLDSAGIGIDRAGFASQRLMGQFVQAGEMPATVFGPSASAALYRRRMLEEVGGFDEAFFAYYEDVDLAWRARMAGWECRYCPEARAVHHHSATGGQYPAWKRYLLTRNRIWTLVKNYPSPWFGRYLPILIAYDLLAFGGQVLRGEGIVAAKGRAAALRRLGAVQQQRRAIQRLLASDEGRRRTWELMEPLALPATMWQREQRLKDLLRDRSEL